ncbi:Thiamine-phosphate synthase [Candidatus Kinetoplastibacterium sorsogonicusi]|uniref:Thiamine-phosphate synthase n=1 Tax=Candidatus Kinetoplastidibacterium kentomonadis TaxID=1576550 RepID=A0A3Q8F3Z1_9PROT|nr:thiamine phosphate synthase [Candidatus Kinetoplastibacterium sorsogonicusi]AWD32702.1 Thiamine-phosphate synthase [Candidatus Kinetoplastibacterium sorsogonicusi]
MIKNILPKGLYGITPDCDNTELLLDSIKQAALGGMKVLQYRNKIANKFLKRYQASKISILCKELNVIFIINDDLELVKYVNADGLHIGREDASIKDISNILNQNNIILGVSCYNDLNRALEIINITGISYLSFGTIFDSKIKPNAENVSFQNLLKIKKIIAKSNISPISIVAIGGITCNNVKSIIVDNDIIDNIAVINGLFNTNNIYEAALNLSSFFVK